MAAAAPCVAFPGAVPVDQKMEALDGAALLAGCRIPNYLRGVRKALMSGRVTRLAAVDEECEIWKRGP